MPLRSFLPWSGGKHQLAKRLLQHAPVKYNTYYEPFLGAGTLLLHLQPKQAVINDINVWLPLVFLCIEHHLPALLSRLDALTSIYHRSDDIRSLWAEMLKAFNASPKRLLSAVDFHASRISPRLLDRVALFYFLLKKCYGGHIWFKSDGTFRAKLALTNIHVNVYNKLLLQDVRAYLRSSKVTLMTGDFEDAVQSARSHDFVYFDPPYFSTMKDNAQYSTSPFTMKEHIRLCHLFRRLHKRHCFVMLSSSDHPFIRDLYQGFNITELSIPRSLYPQRSQFSKELLIRNYK